MLWVSTANNVGNRLLIWSFTASNTTCLGNGGAIFIILPSACCTLDVPLTPLTTVTWLFTVSRDTQRINSLSHSIIVPASIASSSSCVSKSPLNVNVVAESLNVPPWFNVV